MKKKIQRSRQDLQHAIDHHLAKTQSVQVETTLQKLNRYLLYIILVLVLVLICVVIFYKWFQPMAQPPNQSTTTLPNQSTTNASSMVTKLGDPNSWPIWAIIIVAIAAAILIGVLVRFLFGKRGNIPPLLLTSGSPVKWEKDGNRYKLNDGRWVTTGSSKGDGFCLFDSVVQQFDKTQTGKQLAKDFVGWVDKNKAKLMEENSLAYMFLMEEIEHIQRRIDGKRSKYPNADPTLEYLGKHLQREIHVFAPGGVTYKYNEGGGPLINVLRLDWPHYEPVVKIE